MNRWTKLALAAGAVVLAVVLFVVLRPGDDDEPTPAAQTTEETTTDDATTGDTTTDETTTDEGTTEETTTEEDDEDEVERVVVVVRNGQPAGGIERAEIDRGKQVVLVVRSDVADEVHLHGYDLFAQVAPGRTGRISFRADIPGRFEAELEERGVAIAELEVE